MKAVLIILGILAYLAIHMVLFILASPLVDIIDSDRKEIHFEDVFSDYKAKILAFFENPNFENGTAWLVFFFPVIIMLVVVILLGSEKLFYKFCNKVAELLRK